MLHNKQREPQSFESRFDDKVNSLLAHVNPNYELAVFYHLGNLDYQLRQFLDKKLFEFIAEVRATVSPLHNANLSNDNILAIIFADVEKTQCLYNFLKHTRYDYLETELISLINDAVYQPAIYPQLLALHIYLEGQSPRYPEFNELIKKHEDQFQQALLFSKRVFNSSNKQQAFSGNAATASVDKSETSVTASNSLQNQS